MSVPSQCAMVWRICMPLVVIQLQSYNKNTKRRCTCIFFDTLYVSVLCSGVMTVDDACCVMR